VTELMLQDIDGHTTTVFRSLDWGLTMRPLLITLCSRIRPQEFFCGRTRYEACREKARKECAT
jgi:hypothetical protein